MTSNFNENSELKSSQTIQHYTIFYIANLISNYDFYMLYNSHDKAKVPIYKGINGSSNKGYVTISTKVYGFSIWRDSLDSHVCVCVCV